MEPLTEFCWCLCILRKIFKLSSVDIFDTDYRKGFGFYVNFSFWLITIWCYLATILDDYYDKITRFISASVILGALQV